MKAVLGGLRDEISRVGFNVFDQCCYMDEDHIGFDRVENQEFFDDISGAMFYPKMVRAARTEEIKSMRDLNVYEKIERSQAFKMGARVMRTKGVDINKGDHRNPCYR